jgi:WD40 repeat protein
MSDSFKNYPKNKSTNELNQKDNKLEHTSFIEQFEENIGNILLPNNEANTVQITEGYIINKRYQLVKFLGEGSIGRVFLTKDITNDTFYVIKLLHKEFERHITIVQSFLTTFKLLEQIRHPDVMRPYLVDCDNRLGTIFCVFEYIPGRTLQRELDIRKEQKQQDGPFSIEETLYLFELVTPILRHIHEKGMAHGNLKPSNIMLIQSVMGLKVKLLDCGLVLRLQDNFQFSSGALLNSLYYLAPENQIEEAESQPVGDIFSLGVILYQMITGMMPFASSRSSQEIFSHLPPPLNEVLYKATHPQPHKRYQSLSELARSLRTICTSKDTKVEIPNTNDYFSRELYTGITDHAQLHFRSMFAQDATRLELPKIEAIHGQASPIPPVSHPPRKDLSTSERTRISQANLPNKNSVDLSDLVEKPAISQANLPNKNSVDLSDLVEKPARIHNESDKIIQYLDNTSELYNKEQYHKDIPHQQTELEHNKLPTSPKLNEDISQSNLDMCSWLSLMAEDSEYDELATQIAVPTIQSMYSSSQEAHNHTPESPESVLSFQTGISTFPSYSLQPTVQQMFEDEGDKQFHYVEQEKQDGILSTKADVDCNQELPISDYSPLKESPLSLRPTMHRPPSKESVPTPHPNLQRSPLNTPSQHPGLYRPSSKEKVLTPRPNLQQQPLKESTPTPRPNLQQQPLKESTPTPRPNLQQPPIKESVSTSRLGVQQRPLSREKIAPSLTSAEKISALRRSSEQPIATRKIRPTRAQKSADVFQHPTTDEVSLMLSLHTREKAVNSMAMTPDGKQITTIGERDLWIWNTDTWRHTHSVRLQPDGYQNLSWNPGGALLALKNAHHCIEIWNPQKSRKLFSLVHDSNINAITWGVDGYVVCTATTEHQIEIWNSRSGEKLARLHGHRGAVNALIIGNEDRFLFSAGEDGYIKLWHIELHQQIFALSSGPIPIRCLAISPDGLILAAGKSNAEIDIWNIQSGNLICTLRYHQSEITQLAINPYGGWLASADQQGNLVMWDLTSGNPIQIINKHRYPIHSLCISPYNNWLASSDFSNAIHIWDCSALTCYTKIL